MNMTANRDDRLELEFRPWGNSLWHLALWVVMTWAAIQSILQETSGFVVLISWAFSVVLFFAFFKTAQRTRVVLDQEAGHLRVVRRSLIGRGGLLVPLGAVDRVVAYRFPARHTPWRWQLILHHRDESLPNPCLLVEARMKAEEARTAKTLMARWLIRHGWGSGPSGTETGNDMSLVP